MFDLDRFLTHRVPGQDRELVEAHWTMCHSRDRVELSSPFLERKGRFSSAKAGKLRQQDDQRDGGADYQARPAAIVDHLVQHYGKR